MTGEQIRLVKDSWKAFQKIDAESIGDFFYSKLFIDNPKLKKMFPSSMEQQHRKLIMMLNFIILRLGNPQVITEDIKAMALRHKGYGVKDEHYKLVGEALLWTIECGLGNGWNEKTKDAWTACYTMLADLMISATREKTYDL